MRVGLRFTLFRVFDLTDPHKRNHILAVTRTWEFWRAWTLKPFHLLLPNTWTKIPLLEDSPKRVFSSFQPIKRSSACSSSHLSQQIQIFISYLISQKIQISPRGFLFFISSSWIFFFFSLEFDHGVLENEYLFFYLAGFGSGNDSYHRSELKNFD